MKMKCNRMISVFLLLSAVALVLSLSSPVFAGDVSWTKRLKLKGDFRLRHQWQEETGRDQRSRERIRFRLGATVEVSDCWKVGFGLATGGDDPRSTNQTLEAAFSTPDLRLDYAYALFSPAKEVSIWGGKYSGIKKALWRPTDLLWDSELRPEGVGANVSKKAGTVDLFGNLALFILDEVKAGEEPLMFVVQPGIKVHLSDNIYLKAGLAYYPTRNVKGIVLEHSAHTNTLMPFTTEPGDTIDVLAYEYNSYESSFEIGLNNLLGGAIEHVSVFGSFVSNPGADSLNTGYAAGIKIGYAKVSKSRQWQLKYIKRYLERDAWLDIFPDSDAYGGRTDIKGEEVILEVGIARNTALSLDYYHMERIMGKGDEDLLQLDLLLRF